MSRLTLRGRVTLAAIAVLAAGLAALAMLFNVLLAHRLSADASDILRTRASAQLATLDLSDGGMRGVERAGDAALDRDSWLFRGSKLVERPAVATAQTERAVIALAATARRATERTLPGSVRLRAVPVVGPRGDRRGTVVVGVSLVPYEHIRRIALVGTAILSFVLLVAAAIAVRWAVRSALRPIAEMTARAADWSEHDLHQRFQLGPPRDELTTLAATFDGLLRRIEAVLRHEQRLSAEIAHELRTPLTALRGETELALVRDDLDGESRRAFERVLEGSARMQTVIETLLASARMEGSGSTGSCDPGLVVQDATGAVANAARSHGVDVVVADSTESLVVEAGPEIVTQALYPVLENAVRHASAKVAVSVTAAEDRVVIAVSDDGPGLGEQAPESLFAPGASTSGGAGLGLPLARRLARSCGGDVVAIPSRGGCFELRLPGGPRPATIGDGSPAAAPAASAARPRPPRKGVLRRSAEDD